MGAGVVSHRVASRRSTSVPHLPADPGVDYAEGIKLTDPRRMAIYFAKYGTAGARSTSTRYRANGAAPPWSAMTAAPSTTEISTNALTAAAPTPRSSTSAPGRDGSGVTAAGSPS